MSNPIQNLALKSAVAASLSMADLSRKLQDASSTVRYPARFMPDQLVTPRADFGYRGQGLPHITIEHRREGNRLERNRMDFGSPQYGKIADLYVGRFVEDGSFQTFWVEGYAFEAWQSEKHGTAYDAKAKEVADSLPALKTALGIVDDAPAPAAAAVDDTEASTSDTLTASPVAAAAEPVPVPYSDSSAVAPAAAPVPVLPEGTTLVDELPPGAVMDPTPAPVAEPTAPLTPASPYPEPGSAPVNDAAPAPTLAS